VFLAFGRVFSGVAREGQRVHVLSPAYDPRTPHLHRQTAVLTGLFLMMGR
jgi:ribosome assembly protein 1